MDIKDNATDDQMESKANQSAISRKEKYFQTLQKNPEASSWAYTAAAQGIITGGSVLITIPLLKLAEVAAGCEDLSGLECENRIYGFKPSSLLTGMTTISGFVTSMLLPLIGGMIDATPYRRGIAFWTGMGILFSRLMLIPISEETWFYCAIVLIINAITYFIHSMVLYAYLPELTDDPEELTTLNSIFLVIRNGIIIPFFVAIAVVVYFMYGFDNMSDIDFEAGIAKSTLIVEACFLGFMYFKAFYKGLKPRARKEKAAETPLKAITELKSIAVEIYQRYPDLFWFMMALIPFANCVFSLATISITFISTFLKAETAAIGVMGIIFGICSIIGSRIHPMIAKRIDLLNDMKLNIILWIALFIVTGLVVDGPEKRSTFIGFMSLFGVVFGWAIPCMRTIYCCLMPKGRETQFLGIYMFFSTGFIWVPPFLFTILNEAEVRMNMILFYGFVPFAIALLLLQKVRSFKDAMTNVKEQERLDDDETKKKEALEIEEAATHIVSCISQNT